MDVRDLRILLSFTDLADHGSRWANSGDLLAGWVFPSPAHSTIPLANLGHLYAAIIEAGGAKFWYHALRNSFITVAERDLMLPHTLTKMLVNHAPPRDVTEGSAAAWTIRNCASLRKVSPPS